MIETQEYLDAQGRSPFGQWFDDLDAQAAAKVRTVIARMETGHKSQIRAVGAGVMEYRIHYGPGCKVYFGQEGDILVILLGGGVKDTQQKDIEAARELWRDYRHRVGLDT